MKDFCWFRGGRFMSVLMFICICGMFLIRVIFFTRWWVEVVVLRVTPIWEDYLTHFLKINGWLNHHKITWFGPARVATSQSWKHFFLDRRAFLTLRITGNPGKRHGFWYVFCRVFLVLQTTSLEIAWFLGKHVLSHFKPMKKNLDSFFFNLVFV